MPTVVVTGASRGIGLEFVRHYTGQGWKVIATCRDPIGAIGLMAEANKQDPGRGTLEIEPLEVTDDGASRRLVATVGDQPIDLLILNAGVYGPRSYEITDLDEAAWLQVLRTNLIAPLRLAALLAPAVARSKLKTMAFISSGMGSIA
ncbi:MAG: SDR family NAD(P)-dependent oxidoreductase, partial [Alphaproteobacteria bacterium]|nr:SDR family NAD(P)-dependent oxidoreductase [Alphaproteobacteria bacterium]